MFGFGCCQISRLLLLALVNILFTSPLWARPAVPAASAFAERSRLAEGKKFLRHGTWLKDGKASGAALAAAMDVESLGILSASVSGPDQASAALSNLGIIQPTRGSSLAILQTGIVGSVPEPGTDFGASSGDRVSLTLVLQTPPGANRLSFDFNFLSAEYPDFIGSQFNDTFQAVLTDASGSRVIAQASVNSSFFFPASSSRAAGSGFDIFSEEPEGVDEDFGTGLPDAGLTGYQSVDVAIQSSGSISLTFFIEDQGDRILDSAVLLDNFNLAALEILDANDPAFLRNGQVTTDREALTVGGASRRGIAADGTSRLLLRSAVSGTGTASFCLEAGSAPADGGMALPGGNGRAQCVDAPVVQTSTGFRTFAIYRAPDEFNRGGDASLEQRPIRFVMTFTPAGGGTSQVSRAEIQVVRPPVILVHGLWSDSSAWTFPLVRDQRFRIFPADYRPTHASRFATNSAVVPGEIQNAVTSLRLQGIASTQADLVGHSMGGLLGRIWTTQSRYRSDENFRAGNVHKLITLDTPHTGSSLANLLIAGRESLLGGLFTVAIGRILGPIDQGAIDDLAKGSAAIRALGAVDVPSHALVGRGGSDLIGNVGTAGSNAPLPWGAFFRVLDFYGQLADVFPGLQHDAVVGHDSQQGGLPANAATVIGGGDGIHIGAPPLIVGNIGSTLYSNRVVDLLHSGADGSLFARFPAVSTLDAALDPAVESELAELRARTPKAGPSQKGLILSSPAPGTVVSPGQSLTFSVETLPSIAVQRVLVTGPEIAQADGSAPFLISATVPVTALGSFTVQAFGVSASGQHFHSDPVTLRVSTNLPLVRVDLLPSEGILFGPGDSLRLLALGTYADGIGRDISAPEVGTVYQSTDPDIASVSSSGLVTAVDLGTTTLVARNGEVQDSISVTVLPPPATVDPCVPDETSLCLNQGRFRVRVEWLDFQNQRGPGRPVPFGSNDSGMIWFFGQDNWEMLVKVLDGCGVNGKYWVFSAATTTVGYTLTVTDELSGLSRTYTNPRGQAARAITDTDAFAGCPAAADGIRAAAMPSISWENAREHALETRPEVQKTTCGPSSSHLCLNQNRFRVEVRWTDFQGNTGVGTVVPFGSDDSGLFWFFNDQNWEMLVKVLNGCGLNQRFWVFAAATTSVEYTLKVTDAQTGRVQEYHNISGVSSPAITDTGAFPGCP